MDGFVEIPGYPGYKANRNGQILGKLGTVLKPADNGIGYQQVFIYIDGVKKTMKVHRLIAATFIPNPDVLPEIDHIDNDKTNNGVDNIRWITHRDNVNRRDYVLNAKGYCWHKTSWQVQYSIEGKRHTKRFKIEADAIAYVEKLKIDYPRF